MKKTSIARVAVSAAFYCGMVLLPVAAQAEASTAGDCRSDHLSWYQCQSDRDCTVIASPCGWPNDAASALHAKAAKQCNQHQGAAMSCAAYDPARDGTFHAVCAEGSCVAVGNE
jgi:hypothetical protein